MAMDLTPEQKEELERIKASRGLNVPPMQIDTGIGNIPEGDIVNTTPAVNPQPLVDNPATLPEASPALELPQSGLDTSLPSTSNPPMEDIQEPSTGIQDSTQAGPQPGLEGLMESFDRQEQSAQDIGAFTQQEAEERQPLIEQRSQVIADFNKKYEETLNNAAKETEAATQRIDDMIKEQESQTYQGFWQNKSTGEKILGAISVALGAYAQGLSGGKTPNTALTIINNAMKQDYAQYLDKSKKKLQLISQSRASLADKQRATREELLRQEAYKTSQLGQIESKLGEIANKFKGKKAGEQAEILAAQVSQKKNQAIMNIQEKIAASEAAKAKLALEQLKADTRAYVPGLGVARTEKEAADFRKEKSTAEEALAAGQRIDAIVGSGISQLDRTRLAKLRTELGLIQGAMRLSLIGPGAVTDSEREFMQELIGDPSKVMGLEDIEKEKLNTIMNKIKVGIDTAAKNVIIPGTLRKGDRDIRDTWDMDKKESQSKPAPHGMRVKQGNKTYEWNGTEYTEVKG